MTETHQSIFFQRVDVTLKNADGPKRINSIAIMAKISEVNVCYALKQLIDKGRVVKFGNGWFQHRDQFKTVGPHIPKKKRAKRKKRPNGSAVNKKLTTEHELSGNPEQLEQYHKDKERKAVESAQIKIDKQISDDVFGPSICSHPAYKAEQDAKNKRLRDAVDKLIKPEEKVMPEEKISIDQAILEQSLDSSIDDAISKLNMPVVNIPKLENAELKLYILKQLADGIDDDKLSTSLIELRAWCQDVLMLQ